MFYCTKCGNKFNGNERFCTSCGNEIKKNYNGNNDKNIDDHGKVASIILGVISLVGSFVFFLAPIGLILSIVGLVISLKANKRVNNTVGIVLNSVGLFISLVVTLIFGIILLLLVNSVDIGNNYDHHTGDGYNDFFEDFQYRYDF